MMDNKLDVKCLIGNLIYDPDGKAVGVINKDFGVDPVHPDDYATVETLNLNESDK